MLLGPPKSRPGRRVVGILDAIIPLLREHLSIFVKNEPSVLVFPGQQGQPLRRSKINKMSAWPYAVKAIGSSQGHRQEPSWPLTPRYAVFADGRRY